jgi:hypothetical protein
MVDPPSPRLRRTGASYAGSYGGQGLMDMGGVAWERREEGGVGEVPQGTDHGLLRMSSTGVVYGRGGERGALRANAAVEKCEEESPEGDAAVHRTES